MFVGVAVVAKEFEGGKNRCHLALKRRCEYVVCSLLMSLEIKRRLSSLTPMDVNQSSSRVRQAVAQYVRMSTEHQQYSTENQSLAILQYAHANEMEIVRTYSDHGKSGLTLTGRAGLQQLLEDVERGDIDFTAVVVYDVSRWGRFQNPDQGASYEYALTAAGILVHYCAEQFKNDGSLSSALLKTVKRGMAGEYSRELSVKVWAGQRRLIELGFRQGGSAGYGLRRHLVDQDRKFKQVLQLGDRKSLQTDRVILVPGPEEEIQTVRDIYQWFNHDGKNERDIADRLNSQGVVWEPDRPWTRRIIHQILINHKYIGTNVFNRRSYRLKLKRVTNPPQAWIYKAEAFTPLISLDEFERAQSIICARHVTFSDEQLLSSLRSLLQKAGHLSGFLIDETEDMPSSFTFATRFGSLPRAYSLIGWDSGHDYRYLEINREIRKQHVGLVDSIRERLSNAGAHVQVDEDTDLLTINQEYTASIILSRCRSTKAGNHRWLVRFDSLLKPDITIAVRLNSDNDKILDYYLLPSMDDLGARVQFAQDNPLHLEVYRFDDLAFFTMIAHRARIEEVV
jgi:DNA invertase Pin-like site-specific DNA recombinase